MDLSKIHEIVGQLYIRLTAYEDEIRKLRLALQSKDEELGLLRNGTGGEPTRISNK